MNRNYKRRDEIIFGDYDPARYKYGGCARADISMDQLKQLIKEDFIRLDETQNDSPSTKEFIEIFDGCNCDVTFEIYAISPDRNDYRVNIEGVDITTEYVDCFCFLVEEFRYADEFDVNSADNIYTIRAWWD